MKIKLLLTALMGLLLHNIQAQDFQSSCKFDYSIKALKNQKNLAYEDRYVEFAWDILKIPTNVSQINIEITPIYDCFNGINGTQTNKSTFLNLLGEDLINKKSVSIKHIDMLAKCFKWRVLIQSDSCTELTEWSYYTFID